jgi:hypothetical protein
MSSNFGQYELALLLKYSPSGADEGKEMITTYTVLPSSTFLDLKLLILNRTQVPLSFQVLECQSDGTTWVGEDSSKIGYSHHWYPRNQTKLYLKGCRNLGKTRVFL